MVYKTLQLTYNYSCKLLLASVNIHRDKISLSLIEGNVTNSHNFRVALPISLKNDIFGILKYNQL